MSYAHVFNANPHALARRISRKCPESGPGQPGPVAQHFNSRPARMFGANPLVRRHAGSTGCAPGTTQIKRGRWPNRVQQASQICVFVSKHEVAPLSPTCQTVRNGSLPQRSQGHGVQLLAKTRHFRTSSQSRGCGPKYICAFAGFFITSAGAFAGFFLSFAGFFMPFVGACRSYAY